MCTVKGLLRSGTVRRPHQDFAQLRQEGDGLDGEADAGLGLGALGRARALCRLLLFAQLLRQPQLSPPLLPVLLCNAVPFSKFMCKQAR